MAVSDYVTGLSASYGILGALLARQQSGAGCRVETSLLQATLSFIGETAAGYLRTGNVNRHEAFDLMHDINTRGTSWCRNTPFPIWRKSDQPAHPHAVAAARHEGEMVRAERGLFDGKIRHEPLRSRACGELRQKGIAVNALWPRTTIATSAIRNLLGGERHRAGEPHARDPRRRGLCDLPKAREGIHRQLSHRRYFPEPKRA